jgi:hypothetical protein
MAISRLLVGRNFVRVVARHMRADGGVSFHVFTFFFSWLYLVFLFAQIFVCLVCVHLVLAGGNTGVAFLRHRRQTSLYQRTCSDHQQLLPGSGHATELPVAECKPCSSRTRHAAAFAPVEPHPGRKLFHEHVHAHGVRRGRRRRWWYCARSSCQHGRSRAAGPTHGSTRRRRCCRGYGCCCG